VTDSQPSAESELIERIRAVDVRAPERLHRRVQAMVDETARDGRRPGPLAVLTARPALAATFAGALALVAAAAIAIGLSDNATQRLTASQATALTLRQANEPAPRESGDDSAQLDAAVEGTAFPYWKERFGWRSTGERTDHVGGRTVRTVFYANARGQRLGYAIVAGKPAPTVSGGTVSWRGSTPYRLTARGDVKAITWLRNGHLCVMAGRGVSAGTLLALASWGERASAS
jgi:hypothetical protein